MAADESFISLPKAPLLGELAGASPTERFIVQLFSVYFFSNRFPVLRLPSKPLLGMGFAGRFSALGAL